MLAMVIVGFPYTSISGILAKARNVPAQVQALGVGLSYAVANALFGGSAGTLRCRLNHGSETTFFWYVTVMGALTLLCLMLHRKGKGIRLQ